MRAFLTYLFWPNPGNATYGSPKVTMLFVICVALLVAWFVLRQWRKRLSNPVTKKLSRSWSGAALWFGLVGTFLVISRVEGIMYLSMRFLWAVWFLFLILYLAFQIKQFRARHYEKIDSPSVEDPRDKYLPKSNNRK